MENKEKNLKTQIKDIEKARKIREDCGINRTPRIKNKGTKKQKQTKIKKAPQSSMYKDTFVAKS